MSYEVVSVQISDEEKTESVPQQEWKFVINNGNTGELTISDPLLETVALATERAKSEFLKNSYATKEVFFTTYRTDFVKNQIINIVGLPYMVKGINTVIDQTSIKTRVRAIRYE